MPWLVALAVAGVAVMLYASDKRPRPAEGRSWRIVRAAAPPKWLATMIDAAPRLAADRQWIVVQLENKRPNDGGARRQPVIVIAERQIGPNAIAGQFHATDEMPLPAPWGPSIGTPVELALEDIYFLKN
jgi:hypothetical protein